MIKAHRVKSVQFLPIVSKFTLEFDYEEYGDRNMTGATVTIVENMSERKERGGSS